MEVGEERLKNQTIFNESKPFPRDITSNFPHQLLINAQKGLLPTRNRIFDRALCFVQLFSASCRSSSIARSLERTFKLEQFMQIA
jgi:hypothetical protein